MIALVFKSVRSVNNKLIKNKKIKLILILKQLLQIYSILKKKIFKDFITLRLDLNYLSTMLNTNDFLRLYVSTNGTILAGVEFSDSLIKIRNPLMNIKYCMKKIYANYKLEKSVIKLDYQLNYKE